jgi:MFS family permease
MMGYFAYLQTSTGPLMPFLRDELDLSYTVGGLHLSAFAFGSVLVGLGADRVVKRYGRRRAFWGGGLTMAVGTFGLLLGRHPAMTIFGTWLMGLGGSMLLVNVHSSLGDLHRTRRAVAITEANIAAVGSAMLAPLLIGLMQSVEVGWRAALVLMLVLYGVILLLFRHIPVPRPHKTATDDDAPDAPLPGAFWAYWLFMLFGVSIEWCVAFWGADFLASSVGLATELASALMTVYLAAMLFGRIVTSRLARRYPVRPLLLGSIGIAAIGFPLFWLAPVAPLNVLGLFIAGVGIANFFPLGYTAAANVVPDQQDTASARLSLSAGLAIMSMPQILGILADAVQIKNAFGVVIVLLLLMMVTAFAARKIPDVG